MTKTYSHRTAIRLCLVLILAPLSTRVDAGLAEKFFSYCSAGTCRFMTPRIWHALRGFPLDTAHSCVDDDHYALTFDDGPSKNFPEVLDMLARHDVPATFFIVGNQVQGPNELDLLRRAHAAGHQISNHTWSHPDLVKIDDQVITVQLQKTSAMLLKAVGTSARARRDAWVVRPPFGNIDERVAKVMRAGGYVFARWNSDRYDWRDQDADLLAARIRQHLAYVKRYDPDNRSILDLNHDGATASLIALDRVIPAIKAAGYRFVTVSECLGLTKEPESNQAGQAGPETEKVLRLLRDSSFDDLLGNSHPIPDTVDLDAVRDQLWQKYRQAANSDSQRLAAHREQVLAFGDARMRFSQHFRDGKFQGSKPLYIALHGGGGAPSSVNDQQWRHMQIYYRDSVNTGVYVAPRGISDTWDLHFRPKSYPLYDRLIENMIVYENVDPERVYLMGFSAGGDGVYQVTPRMADRFAAAAMSAGHHNWIAFDNLQSVPFLIQVGERDTAYDRHIVAAQNHLALDSLQANFGGFVHDTWIHLNGSHNSWRDNDPASRHYQVIQSPRGWLENGDRATVTRDTNSVRWLDRYRRATTPNKIIWDLGTRADRPASYGANYTGRSLTPVKDLFYWVRVSGEVLENARLEISVNRQANLIQFEKAEGVSQVGLRLDDRLVDLSRPVVVDVQGQMRVLTPQLDLKTLAMTLLERGDPSSMYPAEVIVDL